MSLLKLSASALAIAAVTAGASEARDNIQVAGSSTVLPYASIVAEAFGENFDFPTPVIESGGSSAGLKRFCEGLGENTIDIANASRAIRERELKVCAENGVTDIIEVRFGYDGIVFASDINGNAFEFTPTHWYKAMSDKLVVDGATVDNPYTMWNEIDPALPAQEIQAYVPGTKHGTREVFEDKVILAGCKETGDFDTFKAALDGDKKAAKHACIALRTDGRAVDIDGDYTETLARVDANKAGIGVFGLAFYENNTDRLQVATMGGVAPTTETISTGDYPVSRPLYFYIKKAHLDVVPGLAEFAAFFVADEIAGPDGPLAQYGLVADPDLEATQAVVANQSTMNGM
ncbi:MAG: substrate-binding domain-containing protein [Roseovarius sp.]|nr:substrate-binding domain-containing protein [Roseovarius sp.]